MGRGLPEHKGSVTVNSNQTFRNQLQKALDRSPFATQKALAQAMGVREATVSGWFNGVWPSEESMRALVGALGVSAHWLVMDEGPMRPSDGDEGVRLQVIGKIADGKISPSILQTAETVHRLESLEDLPEKMRDAIATIRKAESNAEAQS